MKIAALVTLATLGYAILTFALAHFAFRITGRDWEDFMSKCAAHGNLTVEGCAMTWNDLQKEKR